MDVSSGAAVSALLTDYHDVARNNCDVSCTSSHEATPSDDKNESDRSVIKRPSSNGNYGNNVEKCRTYSELRVLDLCCAPGLKTCALFDLLEAMNKCECNIRSQTCDEKNRICCITKRKTALVGVDISEQRMMLCRNILKKYLVDIDTSSNDFVEGDKKHHKRIQVKYKNDGPDSTSPSSSIQLYLADGTRFGLKDTKEISSEIQNNSTENQKITGQLIFDLNLAKEEKKNSRKRKRMNKSARAREKKMLRKLELDNFCCQTLHEVSSGVIRDKEKKSILKPQNIDSEIIIRPFDRVLVDAECSTDGAIGHIRHKFNRCLGNIRKFNEKGQGLFKRGEIYCNELQPYLNSRLSNEELSSDSRVNINQAERYHYVP